MCLIFDNYIVCLRLNNCIQSYHNRTENKMIRQLILKKYMYLNINLESALKLIILATRTQRHKVVPRISN